MVGADRFQDGFENRRHPIDEEKPAGGTADLSEENPRPDSPEDTRSKFRRLLASSGDESGFKEGDTEPLRLDKPTEPPPSFFVRNSGEKPAGPPSPPKPEPAQTALQGRATAGEKRQATAISPTKGPASHKPDPAATINTPISVPPPKNSTAGPARPADVIGCILRAGFLGLFGVVLIALCGLSVIFIQYYSIAKELPSIADLRERASQFETTRILDRDGIVLYEILDPSAGRRTYIPLEKISPNLIAATIATEDKGFYTHPGFDPLAILRAFWQNYQSGETVSGASTITQQLVRILLFSPEERSEQTYQRKIREAILAAEITRRYSKDKILELYLNEIFYGNLSYGIEAAAETYFDTTADKLTLAQAAFLAGLPQSPSIYDIYSNPEVVYQRMEDVLVLIVQLSREEGCIYVSNSPDKVCVEPTMLDEAMDEIRNYPFSPPSIPIRHPHWVYYVRSLLEAQFDAQKIYRSGFTVMTTLDGKFQEMAEAAVRQQISTLAAQRAGSGALVAIRPTTGEIIAMVGSADFYNESISGQVNMAVSPRQPGSSIKPLTYLAAFEKGWTPSTLIWDVPSEFPPSGIDNDFSPPYVPTNYDGRYHGPVRLREALANSYNIPAVKTLYFVGVYDNPGTPEEDGLIAFAKRMGITTLTRSDYGLALTLGGGEVTLLDLTGAYATIANEGKRIPPVAITRILDHSGNLVYEYQPPAGEQVIRPEHAYLMTSILSDNQARTPAFGANSVLNLPFPAAVKTGTTNDFRDNWTLGFTRDLAVGVWVGNPDYTPMQNTSGLSGAAPIWASVITSGIQMLDLGQPGRFPAPPGIVEQVICEDSGTLPSKWCPRQISEVFAADQPPLPKEMDLWQKVIIDTWTGYRASPACPDFVDEVFALNITDPWAKKWVRKNPQGMEWAERMGFDNPVVIAPERECRAEDPRPRMAFSSPGEGQIVATSPVQIIGIADATQGFEFYRLEWGLGQDPVEWRILVDRGGRVSQPDILFSWDLITVPSGPVTLRLTLRSTEGTFARKLLYFIVQLPTPTPVPTPTPLPTDTPTTTPLPSETPTPPVTPAETPSTPTPPPFGFP